MRIAPNGYLYVQHKALANGILSYEYEKRRQNKDRQGECKAKIKVLDNHAIGNLHERTHVPNHEQCRSGISMAD